MSTNMEFDDDDNDVNFIEFLKHPSNIDISNQYRIYSTNSDFKTIDIQQHWSAYRKSIEIQSTHSFGSLIMPTVIIVSVNLY